MIYRGRRLIKTCFNSVFRQLFKEDVIFPWENDRIKSKIYINESFAEGERKFPNIIIADITMGNFFNTSYDRNFQQDLYDEDDRTIIGSRYGHSLNSTLSVEIQTLNEFDMEIITDRIDSFFEFSGVQKFRDAGITINNIAVSQSSTEGYGKNLIYRVVYTFSLYSEWETYIKHDERDLIEEIQIPHIGIIYGKGKDEKVWDDVQE